jgi:CelD/BcsL family acetyltransferase involved in cellulose biosynthesis
MTPRTIEIRSLAELRSAAAPWDDLWQRSDTSLPLGRAEIIAQWTEANAPRSKFRAIAVEQAGRFVAALPLVRGQIKRFLPVARLPRNDWSWAGDLLLDPAADDAALAALIGVMEKVGRPLVWFDAVPFEASHWRRLATAAKSAGLSHHTKESFRVGRIDIDHDWPAYERSWTKNHRRQMRRIERAADEEGGATLVVHRRLEASQVEPLLRRGFTVEDASWKGQEGTSVLRSPAALSLYIEQARQIAAWGDLQLTFLELAGRPIAFEYGWNAKGVYYSYKVGYDESYAKLSPGQLLRHRLLEQFFADPGQSAVDFIGPITAATEHWSTSTYPVGRMAIAESPVGRLAVRAYRALRPATVATRPSRL